MKMEELEKDKKNKEIMNKKIDQDENYGKTISVQSENLSNSKIKENSREFSENSLKSICLD